MLLLIPASGLLYVSELIEEHSRLALQVGQRGIYVRSRRLPLTSLF